MAKFRFHQSGLSQQSASLFIVQNTGCSSARLLFLC
jgi:hypothetical protein